MMKTVTETLAVGEFTVLWIRKPIKSLHLRIKPPNGEIVLSSPMRLSRAEAVRFLRENLDWIKERRPRCLVKTHRPSLEAGDEVPLFGEIFRIEHRPSSTIRAVREEDRIVLYLRKNDLPHRSLALTAFYRTELAARADAIFAALGERTGLRASSVDYRRMKTKWGVCHPVSRHIRLNLYLALCKPDFLEYVILHELAHLRHPNHGKDFYGLIERYMPDWRDRKAALAAAVSELRGRLPV